MHKVLIVEDDLDFLQILERRLQEYNFEVMSALDTFQATQVAHDKRPDIIILDLRLPGGGGVTALKNLRLSAHTKDIPIIISTAAQDKVLKETISQQGVSAYFEKPYEIQALIEKIKDILAE
ncbi:MAG: response regulator [Candidatus Aceula meridiana]|nr:response regulator [Candidatus Aceula meridiana]